MPYDNSHHCQSLSVWLSDKMALATGRWLIDSTSTGASWTGGGGSWRRSEDCVCVVLGVPSCPEISQMSWNSKLSWNFTHLVRMSWNWPSLCCRNGIAFILYFTYLTGLYQYFWLILLTTISPYVHCSFMCNIALVTFFGLQYWSASMSNIYEHIKTSFFCVLSLVKTTKMSWNCPEIF